MAKLHRETATGVRLLVVSTTAGLEILRDSKITPREIRNEALNGALSVFADAPVAQCEIAYSQGWNICQTHRELGALELACGLLTASYLARTNQLDRIESFPEEEFFTTKMDWSRQIGKPVPSYMLEKIAELTMFLAKEDWLERTKSWIRLAERQNAVEPPNTTWYETAVNGINQLLAMIRVVETRMAQQIDI